jgi:UDP-3-O-[3-hydroxymyristoyl] N-acetylglucosamine deacetylase
VDYVSFHGLGLHSGEPCKLEIVRRVGPLIFVLGGQPARLDDLTVIRADNGVSVRARKSNAEVDLIEHLFGALAGLSVRSGLLVVIEGPEIPLLDGGAHELARAIAALGPPRDRPKLAVSEAGEVRIDESRYIFETGVAIAVEVSIEFERGSIGKQSARFDGSTGRFLNEIAPARTFGFREDAEPLVRAGRARAVDPHAVMVLEEDGRVMPPGQPARPGEFARHKLLDLLGDLYLYGGPPIGAVRAERPGHRATHAAVAEALERGLLRRV